MDQTSAVGSGELKRAIARLRASVMAVTCGLSAGTLMFVATAWLLIRGGEEVGPNLALFGVYFPGYTVTWPGAVIGFCYGAFAGGVFGWLAASVYNFVTDRLGP